ncbi:MAG: ROK family protein [Spirochaetaceae bacterium]|nr:ROK family protein [Spirochaetaceae bacterium]
MSILIGFDIGGTNVKYMCTTDNFEFLEKGSFPTESEKGIDCIINKFLAIHHQVENKYEKKVLAIGIGCTGPIDIETGIIQNPYTLPGLENQIFRDKMEQKLGIKIYIDNDANTAHLGEISKNKILIHNSIMITFGTGIGCSIYINDNFLRVNGKKHPEIGHTIVSTSNTNEKCYCGKIHCAENILSGTALNRDSRKLFGMTPEQVFDNPNTKEKEIFVQNIKRALYEVVLQLSIIFEPEEIIIGGGLESFYSQYLIKDLKDKISSMLPVFGKTNIRTSLLKNEAGSFGAICTIIENQKRKEI